MTAPRMPRDALVGVAVGAVFGVAWVFWGSGGLASPVPLVMRAVAVVVAVALLVRAVTLLRSAPPGAGAAGGSMFASRSYGLIVLAEFVALVAGNVVLQAFGAGQYVICWTAIVVGVHFLGFGRVFQPRFYTVGAVILGIGVVGVLVGLFGGSAVTVAAVTGLGCGRPSPGSAAGCTSWPARRRCCWAAGVRPERRSVPRWEDERCGWGSHTTSAGPSPSPRRRTTGSSTDGGSS